jgi:hypothetical protein
MMSEYIRPNDTNLAVLSSMGDDENPNKSKRIGEWRFNNNILDIKAIEQNTKTLSCIDDNEYDDSPTGSPNLKERSEKSSKLGTEKDFQSQKLLKQHIPVSNSRSIQDLNNVPKLDISNKPSSKSNINKDLEVKEKDQICDISYLDYTDIDLLSLRTSMTNYLLITDSRM